MVKIKVLLETGKHSPSLFFRLTNNSLGESKSFLFYFFFKQVTPKYYVIAILIAKIITGAFETPNE